ncbi:MerR family transcriptional regulator [Camelimonas fluminis]|uniref:MerR family transcriptional regulator n=1 Tax=Camelimonas fluminis TaxID=1576911 RepID=A0ABV7UMW4_9HYPH|nr:MerR family transcriptional regulator [Camelimonas fluminis]GHE79559.1 MerR family transcriptional regulator [Camelimonas fluminis]
MTDRSYTIGQVSRLTGISARRIRFYADKGLLPPYSRTEAGYRMFMDDDVDRLELITALLETGASLQTINLVLTKQATLAQVLSGQLQNLEHQITAKRRIAATMRIALQSSEPTVRDLKRVATMTDIAHSSRREAAKAFFDKVTEGLELDPTWKPRMIESGSPELPDEPTKEQVEAWIALAKLFDDREFFDAMRWIAEDAAKYPWIAVRDPLDPTVAKHLAIQRRARIAMESGEKPSSTAAQTLADDYIKLLAEMRDLPDDEEFRSRMRQRGQRGRSTNLFFELSRVLRGLPATDAEHKWLRQAQEALLGV